LGLIMGIGSGASVRAAEPEDEVTDQGDADEGGGSEETPQPKDEVAQVRLEIKLESGRVVKPEDSFTLDYGVDSNVEIQADGAKHQFLLNVKRKGKEKDGKEAKEVSITVGYDRDGEAIIAPFTFDAKVKKREVLRIEGGIALAFTITPKKVEGEAPKPEEQPEQPTEEPKEKEKKKKIETCDSDDPLCGVE
jgi:hypothetical protein